MKETTLRFITIYCAITISHFARAQRSRRARDTLLKALSISGQQRILVAPCRPTFTIARDAQKIRWPLGETRRVLGTHTRARESRGGARGPENGREKNERREGGRDGDGVADWKQRSLRERSGGGNAGR